MTIYDPKTNRLILRIVYDGPAYAGKTTNLASLSSFFTTRRRSEVYTAQTTGERTLYLDWLEIKGGVVAGHEMSCHFMTVPGQAVLSRRRQFLMERADVLVFVLGSTPRGIDEAESMLQRAKTLSEERQIPLFIQANKQDLDGALAPEAIAGRFEVAASQVTPAQSSAGKGVKDTAIRAIRAASDRAREMLEKEGLRALCGTPLSGEELVQAMIEFERTEPMSPVQIVLGTSRADAKSALAGGSPTLARPAPAPAPEKSAEAAQVASPAPTLPKSEPSREPQTRGGEEAVELTDANLEEVADSDPVRLATTTTGATRPTTKLAATKPARPAGARRPPTASKPAGSLESSSIAEARGAAAETASRRPDRPPASAPTPPPLPHFDVGTGCIWPSSTGRELLRRVPLDESRRVTSDGLEARTDLFVFEAGMWCLRTSRARCYENLTQGKEALLVLARRKIALGDLLARNTVLTLREDERGRYWLWTVSPWLTSIEQLMAHAHARGDSAALGENLIAYADAALRTLELAHARSMSLSLEAKSFGRLGEQTFYIEDEILSDTDAPSFGETILGKVEAYADCADVLGLFVGHLEHELEEALSRNSLDSNALHQAISETHPESHSGRDARDRLLKALGGRGISLRQEH